MLDSNSNVETAEAMERFRRTVLFWREKDCVAVATNGEIVGHLVGNLRMLFLFFIFYSLVHVWALYLAEHGRSTFL